MKLQLHENEFKNLIAQKFFDINSEFLYADFDTIEEIYISEQKNGHNLPIYCFLEDHEEPPKFLINYEEVYCLKRKDTDSYLNLLPHMDYIDVLPFVPKFKLTYRLFDFLDDFNHNHTELGDQIIESCIGVDHSLYAKKEYADYIENSSSVIQSIFAKLLIGLDPYALSFFDELKNDYAYEQNVEPHFLEDKLEAVMLDQSKHNLASKLVFDLMTNNPTFIQPFETNLSEIFYGYDLILNTNELHLLKVYIGLYGYFEDYLVQRKEQFFRFSFLKDLDLTVKFIIYTQSNVTDIIKSECSQDVLSELKNILTIERFGTYALHNNQHFMDFLDEFSDLDII